MTFVLLKPWNGEPEGCWWEWCKETMHLINYRGGGFDIDENADYWLNAEIRELDSWHELYKTTGFNPLEADVHDFDVWISPEGKFFEGNAHAVAAEYIVDLVYGVNVDDPCFIGAAEQYLEDRHWIKATRSFMWNIYLEHRLSWEMTRATYGALVQYCNASENRKMNIPKGVKIIYGTTL